MASIESLKETIYTWIDSKGLVDSSAIVRLDQNFPKQTNPLIGYRLNTFVQVGEVFISAPDNSGIAKTFENVEFTLSIQSYGIDALQKLILLRQSLNEPDTRAILRDAGLIIWDRLAINDLSGLETDGVKYEERGAMDIMCRTKKLEVTASTIDLGLIETVNGTGTISSPGKSDISADLNVTST